MRSFKFDPTDIKNKYTIQIQQGGTGADNQEDAITNLGGIFLGTINQPGGFAGLNAQGLIEDYLIPQSVSFGIPLNIKGPTGIELDTTTIYEITNYDSFTDYVVSFEGIEGYREREFIYVTARIRGTAVLRVNNSDFIINILGNSPKNLNIVGGDLKQTIPSQGGRNYQGACLEFTDEGDVVIGSPRYSTPSASEVGRIDISGPDGVLKKTYYGDAGILNFNFAVTAPSAVVVTSDAPGFEEITVRSDVSLSIPPGSSSVRFVGSGGPGSSVWTPETPGVPVCGTDSGPIIGRYMFEITAARTVQSNTTTTIYRSELINPESTQATNVAVQVEETYTASSDVNIRNTRMNVRASLSQSQLEIQNGPTSFDSLIVVLRDEQGQVIATSSSINFVSTNSTTNYSTYTYLGLYKVYAGYFPGRWNHLEGSLTSVRGHDRVISWRGGLGDPTGEPQPRLGTTFITAGHKVFLEFRYNTHALSSSPSILTSPVTPGVGLLEQLSIGSGRDKVERELQWSLRAAVLNTTIRSGNGEIRMEFVGDKIIVTPTFSGVIWQNPPSSAFFVIEGMENGALKRTEFAMTQVASEGVIQFEVPGFNYAKNNVPFQGYRAPESSTAFIETSGFNRFGELFTIAPSINTLIIGVKRDAITSRANVLIYEDFMGASPTKTQLNLSDAEVQGQDLVSMVVSVNGDYLFTGFPNFKGGSIGVNRKMPVGYEERQILQPNLGVNSLFGAAVDCNNNGSLLVASAPGINRVFGYTIGAVISEKFVVMPPLGYTDFGRCVRVNEDGTILAISAKNSSGRGVVLVYSISASPILTSMLVQPAALAAGIDFGASLDMDPDGTVLAIGAPGASNMIGRVFLFFNGLESWEHYRTLGESVGSVGAGFGTAVALSQDSASLLVGSPNEEVSPSRLGTSYLYGGSFKFMS